MSDTTSEGAQALAPTDARRAPWPVRAWHRWVHYTSKREDVHALALVRILGGVTMAGHLLRMHALGIDRAIWCDPAHGGIHTPFTHPLLARFGGLTYENVSAWVLVTAALALLSAAGVLHRVTSVLLWLSWDRLVRTSGMHYNGADALLTNASFVLMFSGAGRALSFDAWLARRRARPLEPQAPAWPRYVLIGQLALIYVTTGLQKISSGWVPGGPADALWYILQQPTWQRRDMRWLAPFYPVTQLATLVTWLWEVGGFVLLMHYVYRATSKRPGRVRAFFNRHDVRLWFLAVGVLIHGGIDAFMEIGPFFTSMMTLYAACLHPSELRRAGAWLGAGVRRGPRASA